MKTKPLCAAIKREVPPRAPEHTPTHLVGRDRESWLVAFYDKRQKPGAKLESEVRVDGRSWGKAVYGVGPTHWVAFSINAKQVRALSGGSMLEHRSSGGTERYSLSGSSQALDVVRACYEAKAR